MAFTDSEERELIKLVSEHPLLYDTNDEGYHNLYVKESTWQTVAKTLNKPVEECKKKWKFIRDGYTRYKRRFKGDAVPPRNSKSKRHQLMSFLDNYQSASTEPEVQIDEDNDDTSQETYITNYEFIDENNFDNDDSDTPIRNHKIKKEVEERESPPPFKKLKNKSDYDRIERDENVERVDVRKREDDVDLFCRHIAEVLRNLPQLYKAKAKKQISAIVSDYEIKAAQSGSNTSDTETR
ncbi:uncharacterized protein LOC128678150 [Plodia interpunctella]|uniref:uncharacterized protein LOC128678150 n=1 Tax=Plodia interpunctella TaxID=58824 RepID=UPI002368937A|nr:uncharacterized protein LOC128678150 [Plodia interpunctella]